MIILIKLFLKLALKIYKFDSGDKVKFNRIGDRLFYKILAEIKEWQQLLMVL